MNNGYGWVDASAIAHDIERRNAWNYMDVAGINPASAGRKALMRRYGNSPIVKNTVDAFNRSKAGSKLDDVTGGRKDIIGELGTKVIDKSSNGYLSNQYDDFNRSLSGLPPVLREEALSALITNSALGVVDDRIKLHFRDY